MDRSNAILERLLTLHPKEIDLSLERVERLMADLGHPERRLAPVIHVAGTNGKGSDHGVHARRARGRRQDASTSTPRRTSSASTSASGLATPAAAISSTRTNSPTR